MKLLRAAVGELRGPRMIARRRRCRIHSKQPLANVRPRHLRATSFSSSVLAQSAEKKMNRPAI